MIFLNNPLCIHLGRQREICWRCATFSHYFGHGAPERLREKNSEEVEEDGGEDELGAGGEEVEQSWGQNIFHGDFFIVGNFLFGLRVNIFNTTF